MRVFLFGALALLGCQETVFPRVSAPKESPALAWGRVLAKSVDSDGDVNYTYVRRHRRPLDDYVAWVARDSSLRFKSTANAHAFYLNTYNALAIYQILERVDGGSVCDVPTFWPGRCSGPVWGTAFKVGDSTTSLWEIYNERIIGAHQDIRDLAAMNPGVRSGPPVRGGLYTPDVLKEQLNEQMARWLRHKRRGVRIEEGVAVFNEVFDRYRFEIGLFTDNRDLCSLASVFTVGAKAKALSELSEQGCPHRFSGFDRRLNEAK